MGRFGIKEVCDVTFYDLGTNLPSLYLDTLKISDVDNKVSTSFAQGGRGNPRVLAWNFDRQVQFKVQDALVSMQSLAILAGSSLSTGIQNLFYHEVLTVVSASTPTGNNQVTLTNTPVGSSLSLWTTTDGGKTQGTQVTPITMEGADVATFPTAQAAVGTQVIAFYQYASAATATILSVKSDTFPGYYKVVGDTVVRDETTGEDIGLQFVIPKAKVDGNFTLTMRPDGNPSVLDFTLDVFKMSSSDDMYDMIQY